MFLFIFKMHLYCYTGFSIKNQDGHNQNCLAALYFISMVLKNGKDGPSSCGAFLGQMNPPVRAIEPMDI